MDQESVRNELIRFVKNEGVKYGFIAHKIGINQVLISFFKNNKQPLSEEALIKLKNYLQSKGYAL